MFITQKRGFYWHMTDSQNIKGRTIMLDLEWDIIDRKFLCSIMKRNTPQKPWPKQRAGTPEEIEIAKRCLGNEVIAACVARSIAPSIWDKASKAARQNMTLNPVEWAKKYTGIKPPSYLLAKR